MQIDIFIAIVAVGLIFLLRWGFRTLPGERWQILGCLPAAKAVDGCWRAVNLTFYGFFNALACTIAVALFLIMMGALHLSLIGPLAVLLAVLGVCMPASRLVAFAVEGKKHTFTVGGAFFVGLLIAPAAILLVNITIGQWLGFEIPLLQMLAAMSVAYAIGEGVGRLACISFGCCYGKPLSQCHPVIGTLFAHWNFIFQGETKKVAYAHKLHGQKLFPVQGLTAIVCCVSGLLGCYLFLKSYAPYALLQTLIITQGWRIISEFLRADFRGMNSISAYQVMAVLSIAYALFIFGMSPFSEAEPPELMTGLNSLWDPAVVLCLGMLWLFLFFYTGRSKVTGATIQFHVIKENV